MGIRGDFAPGVEEDSNYADAEPPICGTGIGGDVKDRGEWIETLSLHR